MSIWSPSSFGFGTIFRRTPLNKYPKTSLGINKKDTCVNSVNGSGAVINNQDTFDGHIVDPKFGTSHNRRSSRIVVPALTPIQIYWNSPQTVRVSIRNVGNNSAVFDIDSGVFVSATGGKYGSALQGATGTEPTAGESNVFDCDQNIWVYSVTGTVLVLDEETR